MSNEITEKFAKELNKFFEWVKVSDIIVKNKNDKKIEWHENMVKFEEPARNKLETFIKRVMDEYDIIENEIKIDDNKLLTVKYKLNKPKRKSTKKEKNEDKEEDKTETKKQVTKKRNKKSDETITEELVEDMKNMDITKTKRKDIIQNNDEFSKVHNNNLPEPKIYSIQNNSSTVEETVQRIKLNYKIDLEGII